MTNPTDALDPADDDSGLYPEPADIYNLPTLPATDQAWRSDAACLGMGTDIFFPGRGQWQKIEKAKAICSSCPVSTECLADANRDHANSGIWGATSHRQRRAVRSTAQETRKPIRHGSSGGARNHRDRDETVCTECRIRENADSKRRQDARRKASRQVKATS